MPANVRGVETTHDRNGMSQGFALGLVMCGRWQLPDAKTMNLEFAFQHAWHSWPFRSRFASIKMGRPGTVDTILQMTHANGRKQVPYLHWDLDKGAHVIQTRNYVEPSDLNVENVAASIDENVPAEAWRALAEEFLRELSDR